MDNLPPRRRELVNHLGRIVELEEQIEKLKNGRADVLASIGNAEAAAARFDAAKSDGADSILSAIRKGAS